MLNTNKITTICQTLVIQLQFSISLIINIILKTFSFIKLGSNYIQIILFPGQIVLVKTPLLNKKQASKIILNL